MTLSFGGKLVWYSVFFVSSFAPSFDQTDFWDNCIKVNIPAQHWFQLTFDGHLKM